MSRNNKKEYQWERDNYVRFAVRVPKEYADDFKKYLKDNNKSFNDWCKENIKKVLSKK